MQFLIPIHVFAAVIWVGGMFFAYMALRPAAAEKLKPPERLTLWAATFSRFFPWVWIAIVTLLTSGLWIIFKIHNGFANTPLYVHAMFGLGILMMLIFFHVFFAPYKRLKYAVASQDWPAGGKQLTQIRILVAINTLLGTITMFIATAGPYLIP